MRAAVTNGLLDRFPRGFWDLQVGVQHCRQLKSIALDSEPKVDALVPAMKQNCITHVADDHAVWDWVLLIALHQVIDKLATDFSDPASISLDYLGQSISSQRDIVDRTSRKRA